MAFNGFCCPFALPKLSTIATILGTYLLLTVNSVMATPVLVSPPLPPSLSLVDLRLSDQPASEVALSPEELTNNLVLKAHFSEALEVPESLIQWKVTDAQGVPVQQLHGQTKELKLTEGHYQITLTIGQFTLTKAVVLKTGVITTPYFKADIGRLEVEANHPADWAINGLSHVTSFESKATQQLVEFVPVGFYEVTPTHSGVMRRQVVNVLAGEASTIHIDIPVVLVNLIAVENNQPFFKPVEWSVFRLEKGERQHVGSYYQHAQGITVPAGYYEVVATHASTVRSRQFWVKENTTNKVVLAMD